MKKSYSRGNGFYWRLPNDPSPEFPLCENDEGNGIYCSLAGKIRILLVNLFLVFNLLTFEHKLATRNNRFLSYERQRCKPACISIIEPRYVISNDVAF